MPKTYFDNYYGATATRKKKKGNLKKNPKNGCETLLSFVFVLYF